MTARLAELVAPPALFQPEEQRSYDRAGAPYRVVRRYALTFAAVVQEFAAQVPADNQRLSVRSNEAFGVFVLSFAGHCSERGGSACSLPVMRSTVMAYTVMTSIRGKKPLGR
jgi:hypothetical protein